MNISLILICIEIVILIANNKKNLNYLNIFSSDLKQINHHHHQMTIFSQPGLLAISFYYLLQVLFNLLLIESIRIYCDYLLNKRTLKTRGFIYYTGTEQQIDSNLLKYIKWLRNRYLTYGLVYLVPLFTCGLILLFIDDSLKFFISNLLLVELPASNLTSNLSTTNNFFSQIQTPEDNYPQLGLLILCFAFTYFVLFLSILLIFIAAKGCWHLQQNFTLGKLNETNKFGSTSTYSNTLSTNYNQLNTLKHGNSTSGPQIPQINTLSAINNIGDNSLCSAQLEPSYLLNNYTKRSTMKLLIIVLIGQTFCWSIWLALCNLNSRLNAHLDYPLFNELDPQQQDHSSLSSLLQVLIAIFSCLNVAQSFFVLASAFHKNHKVNSSSIDPTDRNLFGSKIQFGLQWLPICVQRKTGASPLPLIAGNQLSSAASSIRQSQLMIQPNGTSSQQPVYFYSLDPNQLNNANQISNHQLNNTSNLNHHQLNSQNVIQSPPSPIIKLNNINFHTMVNRANNNYLAREVNTMCRPTVKHNDYLIATSTNNRILNNNNNTSSSKSQNNMLPFLIQQQQQQRPQSYASSGQRFDVNLYAPPVLLSDRLNGQLINENLKNNQLNDEQGDYEEVLPNFGYLNSSILQPGQANNNNSLNNILLNATNSTMLNRHSQATLRLLNNSNKTNSTTVSSDNSSNSFNNLQFMSNYSNGQSNMQQQNGQFESEQDIYESVESPCAGIYTR